MITELNEVTSKNKFENYDVCIAGAGVAGITLAIELAKSKKRVLLLEAGSYNLTEDSQSLYKGENVGRPYFQLDQARLRYLGGTSNHWTGFCRPLDKWDYDKRDHIPYSGWPIRKSDVDEYLEPASSILEISTGYFDKTIPRSAGFLRQIEFKQSPPVRFKGKYLEQLKNSSLIDVFLNANLVDIRLNDSMSKVTELLCMNYVDPDTRFSFSGKSYVLAMGGLETPRIMLNCNHQEEKGVGNKNDLVGRFFMDHIHVLGGWYIANESNWPLESKKVIYIEPTPEFIDKEKIGNFGLRLGAIDNSYKKRLRRFVCREDLVRDFVSTFYDVFCPPESEGGHHVFVVAEQSPNRNSRVFLSDEKDRFGLGKIELDWEISKLDRKTVLTSMLGLGRYLSENDYGNVKLNDWLLDDKTPVPGVGQSQWLGAGWHHMGTTRMAESSSEGVVDKDCRVFDYDNLFIAGSSVFATSGQANPTLTIVQLTLRLSSHLNKLLDSSALS